MRQPACVTELPVSVSCLPVSEYTQPPLLSRFPECSELDCKSS